jgi:hypothetical protein
MASAAETSGSIPRLLPLELERNSLVHCFYAQLFCKKHGELRLALSEAPAAFQPCAEKDPDCDSDPCRAAASRAEGFACASCRGFGCRASGGIHGTSR